MWLIQTRDYKLQFVSNVEGFLSYAILSHTWGPDEVAFRDMADVENIASKKTGWAKIKKTCDLAREEFGLMYAWVDTCCIDKTSSSELSEAINTMFTWYQAARVCFVYLEDYEKEPDGPNTWGRFRASRWLGRGWTLQELIAPRNVNFYDSRWQMVGTKQERAETLARITRVDMEILENPDLLSTVPIGKKMSWAAKRRTTRVEDIAYSLLGIFGVHMPLIYGEGDKAFIRLQHELARTSNDLTLFAWKDQSLIRPNRGLFARSPDEFRDCARLRVPVGVMPAETEFALTNRGVWFDRNIVLRGELDQADDALISGERDSESADTDTPDRIRFDAILGLDCLEKSRRTLYQPRWVGIYLSSSGGNYFRSDANKLAYFSSRSHWRSDGLAGNGNRKRVVYIEPTLSEQQVLTTFDTPVMVIYDYSLMEVLHPASTDGGIRPVLVPTSPPNAQQANAPVKPWERRDGVALFRNSLRTPLKLHFFKISIDEDPAITLRFVLAAGVPMPALSLPSWQAIYWEGHLHDSIWNDKVFDTSDDSEADPQVENEREGNDVMTEEEKEILLYDYIFQESSDETGRVRQEKLPEEVTVFVRRRTGDVNGGYKDGLVKIAILKPEDPEARDIIEADRLIILTYEWIEHPKQESHVEQPNGSKGEHGDITNKEDEVVSSFKEMILGHPQIINSSGLEAPFDKKSKNKPLLAGRQTTE